MSCTAASTMPPGCWFPMTGTPPIEEMSTARPYVWAETRRGAFLFFSEAVWATKRLWPLMRQETVTSPWASAR